MNPASDRRALPTARGDVQAVICCSPIAADAGVARSSCCAGAAALRAALCARLSALRDALVACAFSVRLFLKVVDCTRMPTAKQCASLGWGARGLCERRTHIQLYVHDS